MFPAGTVPLLCLPLLNNLRSELKCILRPIECNSFLHSLVLRGIEFGEIRADVDAEFAVHLVTNVSLAMGDFVKQKSISPTKVDETIYNEYVEKTISFIKNGIGK